VDVLFFRNRFWERLIVNVEKRLHTYMEFVSMTTVVRCPRTGRACSEPICQERHWCQQMLECGLSHTGLPLKRKFRPRCCAKTRAGAPCILRVDRESGAAASMADYRPAPRPWKAERGLPRRSDGGGERFERPSRNIKVAAPSAARDAAVRERF